MDNVDYWIWEHASKYGMVQVLQSLNSKFLQINLPGCWLSALVLNRVKKDWNKPGKIDYKIMRNVQEILLSTFKLYRKEVKRNIKISSYIKLILYIRATVLVMRWREKKGDERVWKKAVDEFFPMWTDQAWLQLLKSFNLKDILREEIGNTHAEIRRNLLQRNLREKMLEKFQVEINQLFPFLVAFLSHLQPSTLEKIKTQNTNLGPNMDFVLEILKEGINEAVLLRLLKEYRIRKVKDKCQKILKMVKWQSESKSDEPSSVFDAVMYTLPPDLSGQGEPDVSRTNYPTCTNHYPHTPSNITVYRSGKMEDYKVNKDFPVSVCGTTFEPYWFCELNGESQFPITAEKIKQEKCAGHSSVKRPEISIPNATYVVPGTTANSVSTDTPKKAVLNRLSLSRSGSPRTVKPPGIRTKSEDRELHSFSLNLQPTKRDFIVSSSNNGAEPSNSATKPKEGPVICHHDSDTQPVKVSFPEEKNDSISSACTVAAAARPEFFNNKTPVCTNSSELEIETTRNEENQQFTKALYATGEKQNISTLSSANNRMEKVEKRKPGRKVSRLERKSTEESSSDKSGSSEDDEIDTTSSKQRSSTRSLKTSGNQHPILSGRKLRSGKALGKMRTSCETGNTRPSERDEVHSLSKKKSEKSGPSVGTIEIPEDCRSTSVEADESDGDFQPMMKRRRCRKIESDSEHSNIMKTQSSVTNSNIQNRYRRNPMRSPPATRSTRGSKEPEQCDSTAVSSSGKTRPSILKSEGQNQKATKRKLDLGAESRSLKTSRSPRSKRQYMPAGPVNKNRAVSKAVETLKQNIVCLRNHQDTIAHAEALDRCVTRILRSQRTFKDAQENSDGDIDEGVKRSKKTRARVAKK